ncbi:EF-hand domain-containing protein [Prosthecobacter sp.]|uniref:EF-hand domain-containing protein n=1 Tax=Prosthecobacter sp. TaxID=1965333 RepID=UPI0024873790|nr:EF-hand domain-containing protein [Prosthecobacter sp.]MDI1311180.1 EF-hand domain-containing protein [Prosthecobacter sp.]
MKLKKTFLYGFSFLSLTCLSSAQDAPKGPPPEGATPPARPQGRPPGGREGGPPPNGQQGGGGDPAERIAAFLKNADTDNDGKISKDEFVNMGKKGSEDRFGHMDANSDGFVDKEEVAKMAQASSRGGPGQGGQGMRRPDGGGSPGGDGGGFRRPPGGEGGSPGGSPPGQGQGQGQGMRREGEGGRGRGMFGDPKENFKRMDADGNGSISEEEYIKAMEKMREMMRGGQGGPGMKRPGEGGGPPGEGQGGFRRPPVEGDAPKVPEAPAPAPEKPKDPA